MTPRRQELHPSFENLNSVRTYIDTLLYSNNGNGTPVEVCSQLIKNSVFSNCTLKKTIATKFA